jgi:hypothetical protein
MGVHSTWWTYSARRCDSQNLEDSHAIYVLEEWFEIFSNSDTVLDPNRMIIVEPIAGVGQQKHPAKEVETRSED